MGSALLFPAIAALLFSPILAAASRFKLNCSLPPKNTDFVSAPNARGTLTILWNCLSIIILCTWNIQHLNIPASRRSVSREGWFSPFCLYIWHQIVDSIPKLKWMLLTILIPEYLVGKALNELHAALWASTEIQSWDERSRSGFELIHGYYANMGGYYLDFTRTLHSTEAKRAGKYESDIITHMIERTQEVRAQHRDQPLSKINKANLSRLEYDKWCLNFHQLVEARAQGLFESLEPISARDLEDRNDGDALVKLLAVLQVSWLMIQLIFRKIKDLPTSQLEIAVLAYAVSSFITYLVLLKRPRGIICRQPIEARRIPSGDEVEDIMNAGPDYLWTWRRFRGREDTLYELLPISNDAIHHIGNSGWPTSNEIINFQTGAVFTGVVFGGIHCIAWNFTFPTPIEGLLWRICAVIAAAVPLLSLIPCYYYARFAYRPAMEEMRARRLIGLVLVLFFVFPYLFARIFILFEVFRSLFFLPPDAFVDTWSSSLPHLG